MPLEVPVVPDTPPAFSTWLSVPFPVSPGAGKEALQIDSQLRSILSLRSGVEALSGKIGRLEGVERGAAAQQTVATRPATIEQALFQARARLKIMTAQVAMHLSASTRNWLFKQLDDLLEPEVWHEDDTIVQPASYATYVRLLIFYQHVRSTSLGISNLGNVLAAWIAPGRRLTMEFFASDQVRWALSCGEGEAKEVAAGQCGIRRISAVLTPYGAGEWFIEHAHADFS